MARAQNRKNDTEIVDTLAHSDDPTPNPVWFKPLMFGFMLLGLVWILVFYISQGQYPVQALQSWNILVGFGIAFVGFLMTTRWR